MFYEIMVVFFPAWIKFMGFGSNIMGTDTKGSPKRSCKDKENIRDRGGDNDLDHKYVVFHKYCFHLGIQLPTVIHSTLLAN